MNMNQVAKVVVKKAGVNLAASALTALVTGAVKMAYERYQDNRINKQLKDALTSKA